MSKLRGGNSNQSRQDLEQLQAGRCRCAILIFGLIFGQSEGGISDARFMARTAMPSFD
jgi:hypothetical protein